MHMQPKDPELRNKVGPPSLRLRRHSLIRAHRHVNSLLESLDEDCGAHGESAASASLPDFLQLRRELHQNMAACIRLQAGGSGAVGGDQVCSPHGNQLQQALQLPQQHWPQVVYYTPAGGDQQVKQPHPHLDPAARLTATETSAELLRHKRCPRRRPKQTQPLPPPKKPHGRLGNSDSSIHAVTDSMMTSTTTSSESPRNGPGRLDDEGQQATCSDAFTESRSSDGSNSPPAVSVRCSPLLPSPSALSLASRGVASSPSLTPQSSNSVAESRVFGGGGGGSSKSTATSAATEVGPPPPPMPAHFPEFKLPAATWASAVATTATAAQPLGKQPQTLQQIPRVSTEEQGKSVTQKKPLKQQQQQPQQKQQQFKQLPPLPRQPARCPSAHHQTTNTVALAASSSHFPAKMQQATSTATSRATSTTETPPTAAGSLQANASHQQQLPPPARRQHRHPSHQHYQLLLRRRPPRRRDIRRYLPTDSFSALTGTASTTTTAEDQLRPLTSAHATDPPQQQLQRPLICLSEPQPTILATVAAALDVQQLTQTLSPAEVHVETQTIATAASLVVSGAVFDLAIARLSSRLAGPPRCFRCCLTLVASSAPHQRTAPQLPPQPTLRRNVRQKAAVCVCLQAGDPAAAAAAATAPTTLALRHHQSDCCLLERLSVTARLLGAKKSANCRDEPAPCRSALMSRIIYPEDLVLLPVSADGDDGASSMYDDGPRRCLPATKAATWSVAAPSLVTLRAQATLAAGGDAQRCLALPGDIEDDDEEESGDFSDCDASYDDPDDDDEFYHQAVELREEDRHSTEFCSSSGYGSRLPRGQKSWYWPEQRQINNCLSPDD